MEENVINKKLYITLFVILIIIVSAFAFYFLYYKKIIVSKEFAGKFKGLSAQTVKVEGAYIFTKNRAETNQLKTVEAVVTDKTIIIKTIIHLPTQEELKATNGYFDGRTLKRDTAPTDFATFNKDVNSTRDNINIFAKSKNNIYKKTSFEAEEIKYEIAI